MYLRGVAICCLALVPSILGYDNIHEFMNEGEIRQVFQSDADSVPTHEIFEIDIPALSHRKKRGLLPPGTRVRIRVCDTDTSLWLYPAVEPVIHTDTSVWVANVDPNETKNVRFDQETGWLDGTGQLMEDHNHFASLWIRFDKHGRLVVNGRIEKRRIVIRSLPPHVVGKYLRSKRSTADLDLANSTYHVGYLLNDDPAKDDFVAAINQTALRERLVRSTGWVPDTLYMQILLVADNTMTGHCDIYRLGSAEYKFCIELVLAYFAVFWNGVDLKYRFLENPQLRISISAIVMAKQREALPHISQYIFKDDPEAFDGANGLGKARRFFFDIRDTFPLDTWDVAVTMTRLSIGRKKLTLGNSYPWGACLVLPERALVDGVSFVVDDGSFNAVNVAFHEIGHTLGLMHDLLKSGCKWGDGFVMAPFPTFTSNSAFFSPCSMAELQASIDVQNLTCLYNEPPARNEIRPILLPGEVQNKEEQCQSHEKGVPCEIEGVDICEHLTCYNGTACEKINRPALDGTQCGGENDVLPKICVQSKCLSVHKPQSKIRSYECVENGRPRPDGMRCGDDNAVLIKICVRGQCVPEHHYQIRQRGDSCLRPEGPVPDGTPCKIPNYNIYGSCRGGRCLQQNSQTYRQR